LLLEASDIFLAEGERVGVLVLQQFHHPGGAGDYFFDRNWSLEGFFGDRSWSLNPLATASKLFAPKLLPGSPHSAAISSDARRHDPTCSYRARTSSRHLIRMNSLLMSSSSPCRSGSNS
jgi:hypothetical protein